MARKPWENDPNAMKKDAFISGLEALLQDRRDLQPATLSAAAGLDKSTIRKMLTGDGTRAPRVDTAEKIAAALGTTAEAIRHYGDTGTLGEARAPAPGFADIPVLPWTPASGQPDPAAVLAPGARSVALYQLGQAAAAFALRGGDILAVDLGTQPRDGDLILAGITDPDSGAIRTEVRRYYAGLAVSPDLDSPRPALPLSGDGTVVWRGTVAGMMRTQACRDKDQHGE